jgi:membrane associated rhomboid family serine protease
MKGWWAEADASISRWLTPVVKWLLYVCVLVFVLLPFAPTFFVRLFAASFQTTILQLMVWQVVTYAFVHASFAHILFNLFALGVFGTRLELRWGSRTFLRFVLVVAIGAVLTHLLLTPLLGQQHVMIVGISGVVYGVLLAYAYYYPDEIIYVQFLIPMKVKVFVIILGVLAFLSSIGNVNTGVAHLTHLGGLGVAYLFVRYPQLFSRIPVPDFWSRGRSGW